MTSFYLYLCIITYTSVLERTKEIGILKALEARKKDITRVFDAETIILGVFSGVLGGHIPAKMASKKDAVEALRSE